MKILRFLIPALMALGLMAVTPSPTTAAQLHALTYPNPDAGRYGSSIMLTVTGAGTATNDGGSLNIFIDAGAPAVPFTPACAGAGRSGYVCAAAPGAVLDIDAGVQFHGTTVVIGDFLSTTVSTSTLGVGGDSNTVGNAVANQSSTGPLGASTDGGFHGGRHLLGIGYIDGAQWASNANVRATIGGTGQAFRATHIATLVTGGVNGGGAGTVTWGLKGTYPTVGGDGGVCSFTKPCSSFCPDAGATCAVPLTGQCDFAADTVVYGDLISAACGTNPSSSTPMAIWGILE